MASGVPGYGGRVKLRVTYPLASPNPTMWIDHVGLFYLVEYVPDLPCDLLRGERLLQENRALLENAVVHDRRIRVARDKQYLQASAACAQMIRKLAATHLRHDDVRDQQVNGARLVVA